MLGCRAYSAAIDVHSISILFTIFLDIDWEEDSLGCRAYSAAIDVHSISILFTIFLDIDWEEDSLL